MFLNRNHGRSFGTTEPEHLSRSHPKHTRPVQGPLHHNFHHRGQRGGLLQVHGRRRVLLVQRADAEHDRGGVPDLPGEPPHFDTKVPAVRGSVQAPPRHRREQLQERGGERGGDHQLLGVPRAAGPGEEAHCEFGEQGGGQQEEL